MHFFLHLPDDVVRHIVGFFDATTTLCRLSLVSRAHAALAAHDGVWHTLALALFGREFWTLARQRPRSVSRPQPTWRGELRRIELYQLYRVQRQLPRFARNDFYAMWYCLDGLARD